MRNVLGFKPSLSLTTSFSPRRASCYLTSHFHHQRDSSCTGSPFFP